jgi:hypothetical protein
MIGHAGRFYRQKKAPREELPSTRRLGNQSLKVNTFLLLAQLETLGNSARGRKSTGTSCHGQTELGASAAFRFDLW